VKTAFKDYTRYDSWFGVDFAFDSDFAPTIVSVPAFNGCKIKYRQHPILWPLSSYGIIFTQIRGNTYWK